jgi:coenzyme F420-reducing hydrogenase beta subunit
MIEEKHNIGKTVDCFGCGVCSVVCPTKIINIELNKKGFYEPRIIDNDKCVNCGMCLKVCSFNNEGLAVTNKLISSFGAWSKDRQVRRTCSSGGVAFEIGRYLMKQGYQVCGVKYNAEKGRAEHFVSSDEKELIQSAGSKYIQSYTVDGFKSIDRKKKYVVIGTPCQIDSFRRYIKRFHCEDNFLLIDFFCHGVPSMLLWKKYTKWAEQIVGMITDASWRNKWCFSHDNLETGSGCMKDGKTADWHDSYSMLLKGERSSIQIPMSKGDKFFALFLGDCCLGKHCYLNCKFKWDHSSADIRIGDAWGQKYENDKDGVNAVLCFTKKGEEILKASNCHIEEQPLNVVAEYQMKKNPPIRNWYNKIYAALQDKNSTIDEIYAIALPHLKREKLIKRLLNPRRTFKNLIRRIKK